MLKHLAIAGFISCVAAVPAVAQGQMNSEPAAQTQAGAATPAAQGQIEFIRAMEADHFLADDLIGQTVYNLENESIGDVSDIILNREGQVAGVVIDVGGFLGIGTSSIAVPMASLQFEPDADRTADAATTAGANDTGRSATATAPAATATAPAANTAATVTDEDNELNARLVLATTRDDLRDAPKFESDASAADGARTTAPTEDQAPSVQQ